MVEGTCGADCWGCETCPGCGDTETHLSPSPAGPRCRDCAIEASVAANSCQECGRFVGNANGRVMFGLYHATDCSQWQPYNESDCRLAAGLGDRMLYGNAEDLVRRLDDTTRLMKVCADKGRPELLATLDRRTLATGLVDGAPLQAPPDLSWAVSYIDADPEKMFADLLVGKHVLGPASLPRRFDVIPARQVFLVSTKPSFLLPESARVRLYGWALTFDELFGADEPA